MIFEFSWAETTCVFSQFVTDCFIFVAMFDLHEDFVPLVTGDPSLDSVIFKNRRHFLHSSNSSTHTSVMCPRADT